MKIPAEEQERQDENTPGFESMTLDELDHTLSNQPEDDWLVEGLLQTGGLSLLDADPKAGKSTLARTLGAAVARADRDFLGRKVEPGIVLHFAMEEHPRDVVGHYQALGAPGDGKLFIVADPDGIPPDDRNRELKRLLKLFEDEGAPVSLVVIDTLGDWACLEDSYQYDQVRAALDPLRRIARDTGAHLHLVTHSRKSGGQHGKSVMGSAAFLAKVDASLTLTHRDGARVLEGRGRRGFRLDPMVIGLDEDERAVNIGEPAAKNGKPADATNRVDELLLNIFDDGKARSQHQVASALRIGGKSAYRRLKRAVQSGGLVVESQGNGTMKNPRTYRAPGP